MSLISNLDKRLSNIEKLLEFLRLRIDSYEERHEYDILINNEKLKQLKHMIETEKSINKDRDKGFV